MALLYFIRDILWTAGALHTLYIHFVGLEQLYWETSGKILLMTLLGGPGTFFGPFIGAGAFLYLEDIISGFTQYWMIVLGPIFVLCVLFFPQGIWGNDSPLGWTVQRGRHEKRVRELEILKTENLTKKFGGLTAVSNVDFHLEKNEIQSITSVRTGLGKVPCSS